MEHHVLPWAPFTFKYLGQKPCVGRDLPGRVPSNSAAPQTLAEKSAHAETCSCKYVRYIHTTILICIHGIIHISHIINYKYIYIYVYIYVYGGFPTWGYLGTPPSSGDDTLPLETFPAPQSQGARSVVKAPWRDLLTFWSQMAWSDCHCMAFLS